MNLPNSKAIIEKQNTEENIRLQCAAGYYFNTAENLNYACWVICVLSAVLSFWSESLPQTIAMVFIDIVCLVLGLATEHCTKYAADLRKLYDARVLFGNNGGFEEPEIRKLIEKAISMLRLHRKNYQVVSKTDGAGKPAGKKDWYVFASDKEPLLAQLECQAQNKWWDEKMVAKRRWLLCILVVIAVIVGALLVINLSLPMPGLVNALFVLLTRLVERHIKYKKYYKISIEIDTMYMSAMKSISEDKIMDLQEYIDKRRHLTVFGVNVIHEIFSARLTKLYNDMTKN